MLEKKPIGKYLEKKKSWHKVIGYLKKRLLKSMPWDFTYEFDEGHIRVQIVPINTNHKREKIAAEMGHAGGEMADKTSRGHRRRRRRKEEANA